ncbi:MAG TPA: prepilin-type N-terminal cleavage/methylation domain-containing protein [Steroidobacteraceae bacterium]|jgi:type IV pilus assembly protein PilV|nr:prepilin-type N-terminal cleavage/methylation domain-containing protein [Steroidobacteraceae bacterium]
MSARGKAPARGFSLVEVMVAVIVICVGMLGIAKMQALSLSNMTTSRLRSLAAIQAASLAAAMRTNRQYWVNTTPANTLVNPLAAPVVQSTDAGLQAQASADFAGGLNACVGTSGGGSACTPLLLASYDLARWTAALQQLLPNPSATITCPPVLGANPQTCTIQVTWTERAVAINQQEATVAGVGQFENPSYVLYVEP